MVIMKIVERLAGNSYYLFLDWAVVTALSFIFWILIWKSLPPESAGIIATSLNMIILISTFGILGMHVTLTKLISEYTKGNQKDKIKSLIRFTTKVLIAVNILISVAFFSVVTYFGIDLKIPFSAVVAVSVGIFIWPITNSTTSILYGFQNMKRIYKTDLLSNILKVILAGVLIFAGFEFFGPIVALIAAFASTIFLRYDVLSFGKVAKETLDKYKIIKKYALPALVASLSWALFINTPTIILAFFDSLKSSGLFAAALSIANPLAFIPTIVAQALFPLSSYLMTARNHAEKQAQLVSLVIRYISFISIPLIIVYVFFAKAMILVFTQLEYLEAVDLIPLIGFAILVQGLGQIFVSNLFAIRRTEANRNIYMLTAGVFLATSIPMTMAFGIIGLVESFVVSVIIFTLASYFTLRKYLRFSTPWKSLSKVLLSSSVLALILLIPSMYGVKALGLIPFLIVGSVLYLWILAKLKFYSSEDVTILRFAEKKIRILKGPIGAFRSFVERNSSDNKSGL